MPKEMSTRKKSFGYPGMVAAKQQKQCDLDGRQNETDIPIIKNICQAPQHVGQNR